MLRPEEITVRVLKYDGTEYRHWQARLTRRQGSLVVLNAEFEYDVQHHLLGSIRRGTRTMEYYWLDRWYNIFRFLKDDGEIRLYYCNINLPPSIEAGVLSYVDLDIDVLVQPDFSYQILDLEEFEANAARYGYPDQIRSNARAAIDELVVMIETHQFPFRENAPSSSVSSVVSYR